MIWVPLVSDLLTAVRYDRQAKRLTIRFRKGTIYDYFEVPLDIYRDLLAAPSAGAYFVHSIRDHYRFEEASQG